MSSFKLNLLVAALVAAVISVYIVGSLVVWDEDAEGNLSQRSSSVLGATQAACEAPLIEFDEGGSTILVFDVQPLLGYHISDVSVAAASPDAAQAALEAKARDKLSVLVQAHQTEGPVGGTAEYRLRVTFSTGAVSIVSDCEVRVREQAAGEALPPEVTPTPLVVRARVVPPTPTPVVTARFTATATRTPPPAQPLIPTATPTPEPVTPTARPGTPTPTPGPGTPTATPEPPSPTPTGTLTPTPTVDATNTPRPRTSTPTPLPPTATPVPPTATPVPPTETPVPPTPIPTEPPTPIPTEPPTPIPTEPPTPIPTEPPTPPPEPSETP